MFVYQNGTKYGENPKPQLNQQKYCTSGSEIIKIRNTDIVINRLNIERIKLAHGHSMARDEPPACLTCGTRLAIKRIPIEYRQYEIQ